ncbi:MAG: hypothetical protein MI920_35385 [Kiloniellales bacterium]|nr:hypothetical protein [Kiloniellales bacterium]
MPLCSHRVLGRLSPEARSVVQWSVCAAAAAAILGHASALWSARSAVLTLDLAAVAGFGCL